MGLFLLNHTLVPSKRAHMFHKGFPILIKCLLNYSIGRLQTTQHQHVFKYHISKTGEGGAFIYGDADDAKGGVGVQNWGKYSDAILECSIT